MKCSMPNAQCPMLTNVSGSKTRKRLRNQPKSIINKVFVLLCASVLMLLTSCDHKDLCYSHPHTTKIRVVYDWSDAPDATPAGMCAFFYSTDRPGEYHRFDFPGAKGGEVEIPAGHYVLITYNNDTQAVQFQSSDKYDTHKAFTREGDILEPLYGSGVKSTVSNDTGERVVITPDNLWGCHATDITITDHSVKYTYSRETRATEENGDQVITLYPNDKLCHYSYEVRNVKNIAHINQVSGAISGMSGSMNLKDDTLDPEPVTLPVSGKADRSSGKITGSFLTFGQNADNKAKHLMSFFVVMTDGGKYVCKGTPGLDVTQQVDTAPNPRRVHLIIDGLDLPTPMSSDDGFTPSVDDWGVVEEDLEI